GATLAGTRRLLPFDDAYVLCIVGAELTELLLVSRGVAVGYATVPLGRHSVVRTLRTHAGITAEEAHSALRLAKHGDLPYKEPAEAAAEGYAADIADVVERLITQSSVRPTRVYVVAHGDSGEWFARSLASHEALGELLPGGSVRSLGSRH